MNRKLVARNPEKLGLLIALCVVMGLAGAAKAGPGPKINDDGSDRCGSKSGSCGVIYGYKFNDLNGDGRDDDDPRIEGVTILLNALDDSSFSDTTQTNARGEFSFRHLNRQTYTVCEVAVPPLLPTTPECVNVHLFGKYPEAKVVFGDHGQPSPSPTPSPAPLGCVRTQGFWGSSPAGQALVPILVPGTLSLGSVAYSAAQLDSILDEPSGGNALLILAHQLIATKLNTLAKASSTPIATTIADADTAIGTLIIPPVGSGFVDPSSSLERAMTGLTDTLNQYNNGVLGGPHCP